MGSTLTAIETHADTLVALLSRGPVDRREILVRLRESGRPYFTWAAAWYTVSARLARQPGDDRARGAQSALRSVERAAWALDGRSLLRFPGSRSTEIPGAGGEAGGKRR